MDRSDITFSKGFLMYRLRIAPLFLVLAAALLPATALAQNEVPVTYQGLLRDAGEPANGLYDALVRLGDTEDGSGPVLSEQTFLAVEVSEGLFTLELDYPRDGQADRARWLEINIRPAGGGAYTALSPRQRITPAPEAGNTRAARLKPDNSVVIGSGPDFSMAVAYEVAAAPDGSIQQGVVEQTFVANETGVPTGVLGHFNQSPIGSVQVAATIKDGAGVVVASGTVIALSEVNSIDFSYLDPVVGELQAGASYTLEISYLLISTGGVPPNATTGYTTGDVYANGQILNQPDPTIDLAASVLIDRGFAEVRITEEGVAHLGGGVVVGPADGGDAAVVLPEGSINPSEMLGVPGVAVGGGVSGGGAPEGAIKRVRITAPTDGYVHLVGTATFRVTNSTQGNLSIGGNQGTSVLSANFQPIIILGVGQSSDVNFQMLIPATTQTVMTVSAGVEYEFYLIASGTATVESPGPYASLVATFYPEDYGP